MSIVIRRTLAASVLVASATLAQAQSPDIVVTPTRTAQPIQRAGSAVTVITAQDIEKTSAKDLGEVLRLSPGHLVTSGTIILNFIFFYEKVSINSCHFIFFTFCFCSNRDQP